MAAKKAISTQALLASQPASAPMSAEFDSLADGGWRPLSVPIETPYEGRGGVQHVPIDTVSPAALRLDVRPQRRAAYPRRLPDPERAYMCAG